MKLKSQGKNVKKHKIIKNVKKHLTFEKHTV